MTDRLRREGRWEEASIFRDQKRREFRAAGMKRSEAREAAWEVCAAAFPHCRCPREAHSVTASPKSSQTARRHAAAMRCRRIMT
jgi:hypothetical protein